LLYWNRDWHKRPPDRLVSGAMATADVVAQ
jgi:hypothetical protein